jgi:hypothetical protein
MIGCFYTIKRQHKELFDHYRAKSNDFFVQKGGLLRQKLEKSTLLMYSSVDIYYYKAKIIKRLYLRGSFQ